FAWEELSTACLSPIIKSCSAFAVVSKIYKYKHTHHSAHGDPTSRGHNQPRLLRPEPQRPQILCNLLRVPLRLHLRVRLALDIHCSSLAFLPFSHPPPRKTYS